MASNSPMSISVAEPGVAVASSQQAQVDSQSPEKAEAGSMDPPPVPSSSSSGSKRRSFFGLGKKKGDDKSKSKKGEADEPSSKSALPTKQATFTTPSGAPQHHPYLTHSSPIRTLRSASPAPTSPSPASSQIFERHVQEDSLAIREQAPIPGHITTENHIPPVLDASSEAITNDHLNPDQVEIVMHAGHQPAAVTVSHAGHAAADSSVLSGNTAADGSALSTSWSEELVTPPDNSEEYETPAIETGHILKRRNGSGSGSGSEADIRRLSFISFADVVHSEHAGPQYQQDGSSMAPSSIVSPAHSTLANRSPSPMRSPFAPGMASIDAAADAAIPRSGSGPGSRSPTMSGTGSVPSSRGGTSPHRVPVSGRSLGSPPPSSLLGGHSPPTGGIADTASGTGGTASPGSLGNITIETMRQALRKTGSGDLSTTGSSPNSGIIRGGGSPPPPSSLSASAAGRLSPTPTPAAPTTTTTAASTTAAPAKPAEQTTPSPSHAKPVAPAALAAQAAAANAAERASGNTS